MRIKQWLFIVVTFAFCFFPSLACASREEVISETLRRWDSSSQESDSIGQFSPLDQQQAVYDLQKYWQPKEKSGSWAAEPLWPASTSLQDYYDYILTKYQNGKDKEGLEKATPFKRKEDYRRQTGEAATWRNLIPRKISQALSHKAESPEPNQPDSIDLQDYYARVSDKYENAKDIERMELEEESILKGEENAGSEAAETKAVRYVSAGYNANHMHYKETRGSNTLDEDYGGLEGFYLGAGYKGARYIPWIMGRPFVEGYYMRHDGLITYDGASGLGPLSFEERAEVHRFGVKAGAYRDFFKKGEIYGYFDIGKRTWYRGENEVIQGALTYAEKYWWVYYGLGTGVNYRILPKLSCGVDFEIMTTHKSVRKMRADLYEGATFRLGGVYGIDLKLPIKFLFLENTSFDFTPYFTYWKIYESDTQMISGIPYVEPDSNTYIEGVLVGLSYHF